MPFPAPPLILTCATRARSCVDICAKASAAFRDSRALEDVAGDSTKAATDQIASQDASAGGLSGVAGGAAEASAQ